MSARLPLYTVTTDGDVIACIDSKRGLSITNGVEAVVADLAANFPDLARKRIIYRDTLDIWDGIAHQGTTFLRFVVLRTRDRAHAVALARAGIDISGNDWPSRT